MDNSAEFLREFGDINFEPKDTEDSSNKTQQAKQTKSSFEDLETLETITFDEPAGSTCSTVQNPPAQIEQQVQEEMDVSGFDRLCIGIADFSDKMENTSETIVQKGKIVLNRSLAIFNDVNHLRIFQKGKMVIAGDFKFLLADNQLMLLQYMGSENAVIIPDEVGGVPVTYIHSTAFKKGHFKATTKLKNVIGALKGDNVKTYSVDSVIYAAKGIISLQLPKDLKHVPDGVFRHCTELHSIEIPAGVYNIAPNAFKGSNLHKIIFSNKCAVNMEYVYIPEDASVYVHKRHAGSYAKVFSI